MNLKSPACQADNFYKITYWSTIAWATNNNWEIWHYIFILLVGIINNTQNLITLKLSIISNDVLCSCLKSFFLKNHCTCLKTGVIDAIELCFGYFSDFCKFDGMVSIS